MNKRELLLELARKGAMEHFITMTTRKLGEDLDISQQSASLYLKKLESQDLIERRIKKSGSGIRITRKGVDLLYDLFNDLRTLFEAGRCIEVKGRVTKGLGEGAYYLSQEGYVQQLKEKFSMEPYPGTLNIELSRKDVPLIDLLRRGPGILIEGFRSGERTFGSCLCYPCSINGVDGVIMVPRRTLHENTMEIISDSYLRDEIGIDDDDTVELKVIFPPENSAV